MKHSSDKDPHKLRGLDPRIFGFKGDRIMHHRNIRREQEATAIYENLRKLSKDELAQIVGHRDTRQCMIAEIILRKLGDPDYQK